MSRIHVRPGQRLAEAFEESQRARDNALEAARLDERERCAVIAETVKVPTSGHPQIDAPTIADARLAIAAAIRGR